MKLTRVFVLFLLVTLVTCNSAFAGPFADAFGKCLVRSTTESAKHKLVAWIFVVMSEHSALENKIVVTERQKVMTDMDAADIVTNLFTQLCDKEALEAFEYEGEKSFEIGFEQLGTVAIQTLMQDKKVKGAMDRYTKYFDMRVWTPFVSRAPNRNTR